MSTNSDFDAVLRQDFRAFVEKVFATLNPGQAYQDNWHIGAIIWVLLCVEKRETRRAMVHVPPRMLKSIIVSVAWPAFLLGHNPSLQIFVVSHSLDLAQEHHAAFRMIIEADWYKKAFPTMSPSPDKDTAFLLRTSQGGYRKALSVESKITGQGADIIIIDDPLDASDALNPLACEKLNEWIDKVLMSRFNTSAEGVVVLVMQRLATNDPAAHLRQQEPWKVLSLPARAEQDTMVPVGEEETYLYRKNELLHPQLLNEVYLESRRVAMGTAAFSAQYQQAPVPAGGGYVDISLFQFFDTLPREFDTRFLSIDAASGSDSGSYSVIQVWQISDGRLYLVASGRDRWPFPELKRQAIGAFEKFKADFYLIERAHSGEALVEELWEYYPRETRQAIVQHYRPRESKVIRMERALIPIEAGKVFLPKSEPWLPDLLDELRAFPADELDDQVDALSQAVWFFAHEFKHNRHNPAYKARSKVIAVGHRLF